MHIVYLATYHAGRYLCQHAVAEGGCELYLVLVVPFRLSALISCAFISSSPSLQALVWFNSEFDFHNSDNRCSGRSGTPTSARIHLFIGFVGSHRILWGVAEDPKI